MHGGPGPTFLAQSVVDYIIHSSTEGVLLDVPDNSVQNSLEKVGYY